ncbi:pentapeptide repeat-containing protein [Endozoicomonas arenosclerae]|uniref:pentapeptide repeat-containing protein n=1 Tax=Endozoicomonas arenosclerae TaxID=1633495 RepID=UPI0007851634|nr:pentapeptide repeat-containing protein [Endozoicomonas arenosclerae]
MTAFNHDSNEYLSQTFDGVNLSNQELQDFEFDDCTFTGCDFSEATFEKCRFIDCVFQKCNLSLAQLRYCRFNDVSFQECKLVGVDWTKADWPTLALPSPIHFDQCILNDSSFFGLHLAEIRLRECKIHNADFTDTDLNHGEFCYSDFTGSTFARTNLENSDFTEASQYDIDINNNRVQGAKFTRYEAARLLSYLGIELVD